MLCGGFLNRKKTGFTLIEALVFLFIFSVIVVTFYSVWVVGTNQILLSKNRLMALALANEKMEILRNMSYDDIALTTSNPPGILLQNETVTRNNQTFNVLTQISKIDDPYDGTLGGNPNDTNFVDYKLVKITVSWNDGTQRVSLSSRFVPSGIEQPVPGQGVLVINVTSDKAGGVPVANSTVRVVNSELGFDETHSTDGFGRLMLVGLSESIKKYEITLTKSGYETISTLAPYPEGPYNPPAHEHASVIAAAVNVIDIFQNQLANLNVKTVDYLGNSVANIDYHLKGGRKLGINPNPPNDEVYSIDESFETNSSGEKNHSGISPGNNYEFTLEETGYVIIGIDSVMPFSLIPGETKTLTVKVSPNNVTAILIQVKDSTSELPIEGANVQLTKDGGYDVTIVTGSDGMAFFPNTAEPPFVSGTYNLNITANGYQNYSNLVDVNENQLREETILLTTS